MPTQEERLNTLEIDLRHFKAETVRTYSDMAHEMTIIKGISQDAVQRLAALSKTMEKRFERVDDRLDGMSTHLESMDKRLDGMSTHLESMDKRLDGMETMLGLILERLPI